MKPLIGITTGEIVNQSEPWVPSLYGQKHEYCDAVVAAGGIPILIPILPETHLKELYARLDGIIFAGGNDVDPQLYGEPTEALTRDISPARDQAETMLMTWALVENKPLLAICRGMQLFNVLLGGSLHQDLATYLPSGSDHELSIHRKDFTHIAHHLKVSPTSKLAYITNSLELAANSRHHQGIKEVAHELQATAWAEDGLVEAIEHPLKKFAVGVQCHPESLFQTDQKWAEVFNAFLSATHDKPSTTSLAKLKKMIRLTK